MAIESAVQHRSNLVWPHMSISRSKSTDRWNAKHPHSHPHSSSSLLPSMLCREETGLCRDSHGVIPRCCSGGHALHFRFSCLPNHYPHLHPREKRLGSALACKFSSEALHSEVKFGSRHAASPPSVPCQISCILRIHLQQTTLSS